MKLPAAVLLMLSAAAALWWWFPPDQSAPQRKPTGKTPPSVPYALPLDRAPAPFVPPQAVTDAAVEAPTGEQQESLCMAVANWAATHPAAAEKWVRNHASPELRSRLLATLAIAMAEQSGPRALALAADAAQPSPEHERTHTAIVQRWVQHDPAAAAAWAAQLPGGPLRRDALTEAVKLWSLADAAPVSRWLESLPPGPVRDEGLSALAASLAVDAPQAAAAWAARIADPALRTTAEEQARTLLEDAQKLSPDETN